MSAVDPEVGVGVGVVGEEEAGYQTVEEVPPGWQLLRKGKERKGSEAVVRCDVLLPSRGEDTVLQRNKKKQIPQRIN